MSKLLFAISCFTLIDIQTADKNGECRSDCKHMGYVSGAYFHDTLTCWYADRLQLQLQSKTKQTKSVPLIPYKNSEDDTKLPWEN